MYFRLNPECYYIEGEQAGAIYDLLEGSIYSLDHKESETIKMCEKHNPADENNEFLRKLQELCVGNFYENVTYVEKLRSGSPLHEIQKGLPPVLLRAVLEINNRCEQTCWYCGIRGLHRSLGCMGCNKWGEQGREVSLERWKEIIDALDDLECNSIWFTGGDLSMTWDKTLDLVNYANRTFGNIFVILNSQKITDTISGDLFGKAQIVAQMENPDGVKKEWINVITTEDHEIGSIESLREINYVIDFVSKDFFALPHNSPVLSKDKLKKTGLFSFTRNKKVHPCLGNSLTISWRGDVLPCPMMRSHTLGNIQTQDLCSIFENDGRRVKKFWDLRLDTLKRCGQCEFRYGCNDCRALEESLTGDLNGKALCGYDSAKGAWI